VVVHLLVGTSLRLDGSGLRLAFGLSGAETRLCEILVNGRSLAEAADMLHISEGTARQRIKTIFQKTGVHRQGQLIALVSRFSADP
jgi:DNA-binding CsgD family transcriptional regulator